MTYPVSVMWSFRFGIVHAIRPRAFDERQRFVDCRAVRDHGP
jgi:hypothetical protein